MTKFFRPVRFTYSMRVTRMPALPTMNRPGSMRMRSFNRFNRGTSVAAYLAGVRMFFAFGVCHQSGPPLASAG